uniref:SWIRM domain-containing protein n=1 Tax=Mesocestoides corti TaxID=53468 RepID=A0A5K3EIL5_MESCO
MPRGRPRRNRKLENVTLQNNGPGDDIVVTEGSETEARAEEACDAPVDTQTAEEDGEAIDSDTGNDRPAKKKLTEGKIDVDEDLESDDVESGDEDAVDDGEDIDISNGMEASRSGQGVVLSTPAEKAADTCRLPPRRLTPDEYALFPFLGTASLQLREAFLVARNAACLLWTEDPTVQVTTDRLMGYLVSSSDERTIRRMYEAGLTSQLPVDHDKGCGSFPPNWNPWATPVARQNLERLSYLVVLFLERFGFINYGAFKVLTAPLTQAVKSMGGGDGESTEKGASRRVAGGRSSEKAGTTNGTVPIKLIVCGAGAAGLIAARQLTYFGAMVTVLEARDRVGGRIWTYKKADQFADLGAMIITGMNGNPSSTLAQQGGLALQPISQWCTLYAPTGRPVSREKDERMEEEFNRLLATAAHLANNQVSSDPNAASLSLGGVIDDLIRYQENHIIPLKTTHRKLVSVLLERKAKTLNEMADARKVIEQAYSAWQACCLKVDSGKPEAVAPSPPPPQPPQSSAGRKKRKRASTESGETSTTDEATTDASAGSSPASKKCCSASVQKSSKSAVPLPHLTSSSPQAKEVNADAEFEKRRLLSDLHRAWKLFDPLQFSLAKINRQLEILAENPPRDVYLTPSERNLVDWHLANLEFANATELKNLSLLHWDQDDAFELGGPHCTVRGGFGQLLDVLTGNNTSNLGGDRLPLKAGAETFSLGNTCGQLELRSSVKAINVIDTGVTVESLNTAFSEDEVISYSADAVLCTLPLGVLKKSVSASAQENDKGQTDLASVTAPLFRPPLPQWKVGAIERLGFGILNKVVLFFDRFFWDRSQRFFGCVHDSTERRGELFLFWSITDKPCLIALVAGKAAITLEEELSAKEERSDLKDDSSFLKLPIVSRAMTILRKIFGRDSSTPIPDPLDAYVTRWSADINSRGSYSYVAVGATGDDYDLLAAPLQPHPPAPVYITPEGDVPCTTVPTDATHPPDGGVPRVFFAGEHTCRYYPASVHGAMFSGLREVARIANTFFPGETPVRNHGFTLDVPHVTLVE